MIQELILKINAHGSWEEDDQVSNGFAYNPCLVFILSRSNTIYIIQMLIKNYNILAAYLQSNYANTLFRYVKTGYTIFVI